MLFRSYMDPMTREEVDKDLERLSAPDMFKWDKWEDPNIEFKIVEKKD